MWFSVAESLTCTILTCECACMPKAYARIPLDVKPEFAAEIDRAMARLTLATGERLTRTAFIVRTLKAEIERITKEYPDKQPSAP